MAAPALDDTEFPLAHCETCARDVLTYVADDLGDAGEQRRCLHCDTDLPDWRAVDAKELEAAGYGLVEARGCGNGGGCSSGCGMRR